MGCSNIQGSKYKEKFAKQTEKEKPTRQEEIHEISGLVEVFHRGGSNEISDITIIFLNIALLLSVIFIISPFLFTAFYNHTLFNE